MPKSTDWVVSLPVHNLAISNDIGGVIRIGRVTFVASRKIPYLRKRLNIPDRISEYSNYLPQSLPIFKEVNTYAFITTSSRNKPDFVEEHGIVRDAIWILRSSQYSSCRRDNRMLFGSFVYGSRMISSKYFFEVGGKKNSRFVSSLMTPVQEYTLDRRWKDQEMKYHFFDHLIRVVNGNAKISSDWRRTIEGAAILAAKSHYSDELSEAFLYGVIALESLLNSQNTEQKISSEMYEHIYSFFGWLRSQSDKKLLKKQIERLYHLRCRFVHSGDSREISVKDLLFVDELLRNLLYNICRFIAVFPSQNEIVKFSEKIQAQETLGIKITRPKRFLYVGSSSQYSAKEIAQIKKIKNW